MSELKNSNADVRYLHWQLLTTVSGLALLGFMCASRAAVASDDGGDRPTVWIELGGQLQQFDTPQEAFIPSLMRPVTTPGLASALNVQNPPATSFGIEGSVTLQPSDSGWVFSVGAQYGRANMARHKHQQTANAPIHLDITYGSKYILYGSYYPSQHVRFADGKATEHSQHLILDFKAGKDVGVGLFGRHSVSTLNAGVRFAQFNSKASTILRALPDLQYPTAPIVGTIFAALPALQAFQYAHIHFHAYTAISNVDRSFEGLGPSLEWNSTIPFAGSPASAEFSLEWGVNAAVLFGRQKASGHHQSTVRTYSKTRWSGAQRAGGGGGISHLGKIGRVPGHFVGGTQTTTAFHNYAYTPGAISEQHNAASFHRARTGTVPNLGGFVGISARYADVKMNLGYRADFFWNAMDGGNDVRNLKNVGFFGPYATITIGLP